MHPPHGPGGLPDLPGAGFLVPRPNGEALPVPGRLRVCPTRPTTLLPQPGSGEADSIPVLKPTRSLAPGGRPSRRHRLCVVLGAGVVSRQRCPLLRPLPRAPDRDRDSVRGARAYHEETGVLFATSTASARRCRNHRPAPTIWTVPARRCIHRSRTILANAAEYVANPPSRVHLTMLTTFPDLAHPATILPAMRRLEEEYPPKDGGCGFLRRRIPKSGRKPGRSRPNSDRPPIVVPPTVLVQGPPEAWGEGR